MRALKRLSVEKLVEEGSDLLRDYLDAGREKTERLRSLAEVVVELRSRFQLEDGRTDWSGRSQAYRRSMGEVYQRAQVPQDQYDTVQAALRYHVGNLLRQRVQPEELSEVGLTSVSPRERLHRSRDVVSALAGGTAELATTARTDIPRLAAYADAILEAADLSAVRTLKPEQRVAADLALEAVQQRAGQMREVLADVEKAPARPRSGRPRTQEIRAV